MSAYRILFWQKFVSVCTLVSLLLGTHIAPLFLVYGQQETTAKPTALPQAKPLYRAYVHFRHEGDKTHLAEWTTQLLQLEEERALVIVNEDQLTNLARMQLKPQQVDSLAQLGFGANSLQRATSLQALAVAPMSDSDGDGLTDTEEVWWCTDPYNPNSDGDVQGFTDGEEVAALLDVSLPRSVRWGYGAPFGPPNAWPDFNGADGNANTTACNDGDFDTIPDYAEVYMVGSRVPSESTDLDKFDDGQELFGITYCPGAPTSCGYGSYPRAEYWSFIKASMPTWVEPPGDNIFVAAFPVPEVSVVEGSWTVERVTTITTEEGLMTETTNNYATSATLGQSTSLANTITWNEWEEVSESVETPLNQLGRTAKAIQSCTGQGFGCYAWGTIKLVGGTIGTGASLASLPASCTAGAVISLGTSCALSIGGLVGSADLIMTGLNDLFGKDEAQNTAPTTIYNNNSNFNNVSSSAQATAIVSNNIDFQGVVNSLDGVQYAINQQSQLLARGLHDVSYAISQPRFTETRTNGRSYGGSQTTTHEVYEEHTITEGEAFTTGANWSTAWAVDSSHAADLTFTYNIQNNGTEYAREISNLVFNIYLGDDTTPIISYPAWQQFANGKLENVFPNSSNSFASNPVPLTLEQMKRIDLGEKLTVVLEDFSYGADELFYQDAVNGGVTFFIEDGVDDNDELVDMYVIPTWGTETVQDVLTRYFPSGVDSDNNINALWTPEFNGTNPPTWQEHFLSDIAWWNIYLSQADAGNTALHELNAAQGSALLFRFNRDSDRDGYQDRVEQHYGTDKNDPASHPQPEILAGYTSSRSGNNVTVLLKLSNSGTFDAYGIDAVMYAPDDTVTITNNTVGGNGRVRPNQQIAVGSLILAPNLANWGSSTADPYVIGNYSGASDKTFTFTTNTAGVVGQGSTKLNWSNGSSSGTLDLGSSYHAPLPIAVAEGVEIGFDTGTISNGSSFTVQALTPRDTFQYTINAEPYTPPVIVVSYSDPQGSHRFVTPVEIESLATDLTPHAGQMLPNVGLSIVTTDIINPVGINTTQLIVNSPHPEPIENGHLYLNFVADGELVAEITIDTTIQPGPTIHKVDWSTDTFSQTYRAEADNLLIAFWTDAQNNIIDSAARPLNSFQPDPQPEANIATTMWNIGTVTQGTVAHESIAVANTGLANLLADTTINGVGLSASTSSTSISPAAFQTLDLTLDTATLPLGTYNGTVMVRTNDAKQQITAVQVVGIIAAPTHDATAQAVETYRPWNQLVTVQGTHQLNETITFDHTIVDDPSRMHPLYVYDETGRTLFGVGEFGVDFGNVATTTDIFGTGRDGDVTVANGQTIFTDNVRAPVTATALTGQTAIQAGASSFQVGDEILIIQMQRDSQYNHEFATIVNVNGTTLEVADPLTYTYSAAGNHKAQIIRIPHYHNVVVQNGGILTAHAWDGSMGGILVFRASGEMTVQSDGIISMTGKGYRGGDRGEFNDPVQSSGWQGESLIQIGSQATPSNYGGGGGGQGDDGSRTVGAGGGGGGYSTLGSAGETAGSPSSQSGGGGGVYGVPDLTARIFPGSGGGGGGSDDSGNGPGGFGGNGGGVIVVAAHDLTVLGEIEANGANGTSGAEAYRTGGGGGGAGGSVFLRGFNVDMGINHVSVQGGVGGPGTDKFGTNPKGGKGGNGGLGRIHVQYCNNVIGTSTSPVPTFGKIECFVTRQLSGSPNTELALPMTIEDYGRFQLQYGQRGTFSIPGSQDYIITLPKRTYATATLEALFTNLGSANFTAGLDIGADGSVEWNGAGQEQPTLLTPPDLAAELNAYLQTTTVDWGTEVTIPIRVTLNTTGDVFLTNFAATAESDTDLVIGIDDLTVSNSTPIETNSVTLTATVQNNGHISAENVIVSFFAGDPNDEGIYLGSRFVPNLNVGEQPTTTLAWDTTGYSDQVELFVMVDPVGQISEINENNNVASTTAMVQSRPDLQIAAIELASLPRKHRLVEVKVSVHNGGNTNASENEVTLYQGDPENGGSLVGQATLTVVAQATATVSIPWQPKTIGEQRLYAVVDETNAISEFDETNNNRVQVVHVGWGNPAYINAGSINDLAYDEIRGYGHIGAGTTESCGEEPYQTYRKGESAQTLHYRFDHLLSGRFYHLDLSFYLCSGSKTMRVLVDGVEVESTINVNSSNNEPVYRSILLDPSLYADNSIDIAIEKAAGLGGPVVSELMLSDIHYCYRDSGYPDEVAFANASDGCGWLDGEADQSWGNQPFQSVRFDDDGQLRYQFDNLNQDKAYRVNLTFYDQTNIGRVQSVGIDGYIALANMVLSSTLQTRQIEVLSSTYQSDGSITVTIDGTGQVLVSEIALEEKTVDREIIPPPNNVPIVRDDSYTVLANEQLNVAFPGVLANDEDFDGDTLVAILQTNVSHGILTLNSNGSFSYQPNPGFSGQDSFTYRAHDGLAQSIEATVIIMVGAVENQAPHSGADHYEASADNLLTIAAPGVLMNDEDPDGDGLTAVLATNPNHGQLTLSPEGGFIYQPNIGFIGEDTFTYYADDGRGGRSLETAVTIEVRIGNIAPQTQGESYGASPNKLLVVATAEGVLANDVDVNGDVLTAVLFTDVANGQLTFMPDGSFTYLSSPSYVGLDSFAYRAFDGELYSQKTTVTINVSSNYRLFLPLIRKR